MIYCIDTSSLIFAKNSFPTDLFPGFWTPFEDKIRDKSLISIHPVWEEIGKGDDGLPKWAKDNHVLFHEVTTEIGYAVKKVITAGKEIVNPLLEKDEADPYLIALAMVVNGTVVTQEKAKTKKGQIKIPIVCQRLNIPCTDLHGMMRDLGWSFSATK
jgi:hypothetical protein